MSAISYSLIAKPAGTIMCLLKSVYELELLAVIDGIWGVKLKLVSGAVTTLA